MEEEIGEVLTVDTDLAFEDDVLIEASEDVVTLDVVELEVELALEEFEPLVLRQVKGVAFCTRQECG